MNEVYVCPDCGEIIPWDMIEAAPKYIPKPYGCCDHKPLHVLLEIYEKEMSPHAYRAMRRLDDALKRRLNGIIVLHM